MINAQVKGGNNNLVKSKGGKRGTVSFAVPMPVKFVFFTILTLELVIHPLFPNTLEALQMSIQKAIKVVQAVNAKSTFLLVDNEENIPLLSHKRQVPENTIFISHCIFLLEVIAFNFTTISHLRPTSFIQLFILILLLI